MLIACSTHISIPSIGQESLVRSFGGDLEVTISHKATGISARQYRVLRSYVWRQHVVMYCGLLAHVSCCQQGRECAEEASRHCLLLRVSGRCGGTRLWYRICCRSDKNGGLETQEEHAWTATDSDDMTALHECAGSMLVTVGLA